MIRDGISREMTNVRLEGIYSPYSSNNQVEWTHPATTDFLLINHLINFFNPRDPNASGGHLIIDWSNKTILNKVMIPYYQCAYTQKCISPRGSNMKNHRQDQAVLSALLSNLKTERSMCRKYIATPDLRLENGNDVKKCDTILGNELKSIQNIYQIDVISTYLLKEKYMFAKIKARFQSRPEDQEWDPWK